MTKLTLTIEGDATALAAVLAVLSSTGDPVMPEIKGNDPSTPTGAPTAPSAPISPAPIPMPVPMPQAPSGDDDDEGEQAATGDVDASGLPWDERIHAGTKTVTAKGMWKKRKGVDAATISAVEQALRGGPPGLQAAQTMPPIPAPMAVPIGSVPPMPGNPPSVPTAAPSIPVAPTPPTAPSAVSGDTDMMTLMSKVAEKSTAGVINADYIAGLAQRCGANALTDLMGKQELINYAVQLMTQDGVW